MTDRFERLAELFELCSDRSPEDVARILDERCADDPDLRAAVETLLARDADPEVLEGVVKDVGHVFEDSRHDHHAAPEDMPESIGRYEIIGVLGYGGMGTVFSARDPDLGRLVALKLLPRGWERDPSRYEQFRREAQLLAQLTHPNIAVLYSLEESEGRAFLTMEHILGETLGHRLERKPPSLSESISWGRQIADALQTAHANGVTHRDLKPSNVMISEGGALKVLDFGLAVVSSNALTARGGHGGDGAGRTSGGDGADGIGGKLSNGAPAASEAGDDVGRASGGDVEGAARQVDVPAGSPGYISPEQLRGEPATASADVWGWGCVVYECLTGRSAFPGTTPLERVTKTLEGGPDPALFPSTVPTKLTRLVLSCLASDPRDRPSSVDELQERLREVSRRQSDRQPSRLRVYWAGAALVLLAVIALASWRVSQDERRVRDGMSNAESGDARPIASTPRRVTRSGFVWGVDLSWSGEQIACVTNPGDIVVVDLETNAERLLRNDPTLQAVAWSPDGAQLLAYSLGKERDGSFLLSTSDGEMKPIGPPNFQGRCWSSDGSRILGPISKTHLAQGPIYVYDLASDSVHTVPLPEDFAHVEYDWSARNGWILVLGTRPGEPRGAWMVRESGGEPIRVGGAETDRSRWAPDGKHLLVVDRLEDTSVLSALRLTPELLAGEVDVTGPPESRIVMSSRILELPGTTASFRVSNDGESLAFLGQIPRSTLWRLVRREDGPGFDANPIWGGTVLASGPKIRPGGDELAFLAGTFETTRIYRLSFSGGEPEPMTEVGFGKAFLAWSPDGSELAFGADDDGREQLRIVSTIDGGDRPVPGAEGRAYLDWMGDGRILFHSFQDDNRNFRLVSPSGDDQRPLFDPPRNGTLFQVAASHSGQKLAVAGARGDRTEIDVWLVSPDSPEETLLFEGTAVPITWSDDDEWVYLVRETRESRFLGESVGEVLRVRVEDGKVETVVALPPGDLRRWTDVDISPDGRTIVCALSQDQRDVWIADLPPEVLSN